MNRLARGDAQPGDGLDDLWRIFVEYDFNALQKITVAKRIARRNENDCRELLANFEPILQESLQFLGFLDA